MEIGIALANLCFFADKKQKINLVNRGMIDIWNDLLSQYHNHEETLIFRILEGVEMILFLGLEIENIINVNPIKMSLEKTDIPKIISELQDHPREKIYKICFRILDKFFNSNDFIE